MATKINPLVVHFTLCVMVPGTPALEDEIDDVIVGYGLLPQSSLMLK